MQLNSAADIQQQFAEYLKQQRQQNKFSRTALAERSTVPAPTIKKFETTGQISLRQFLLLWQSVDDLQRLQKLTQAKDIESAPKTIDEVLTL